MFGFFPIWGTHMVFTFLFAAVLKFHMASMFLGSWISGNPLTIGPILFGEFYLGKWLLGRSDLALPVGEWSLKTTLDLGWDVLSCMLVGFVILGVCFGLLTYPIVLLSYRHLFKAQELPDE
jgi:uncharacterized protein (DUF2062 family)